MGGWIRYHAPARRWIVGVPWRDGCGKYKEERFWRYQGEPLYDERTARKLLSKIQADIDNGIFDPRTYRPDSPLSISEFSKVWLRTSPVCKNTKKIYQNAIQKAIQFFGKDFDIRHFTHSKLLSFSQSLNLSNDAKYNVMGALKTMLRFYKRDVPSFVLPIFPPMSKTDDKETRYLTFEQQEAVLSCIPERHQPIFALMMEYGIRPQEATALKWDCVTETEVIFRRSHSEFELRETTKTGAIRTEALTSRAKEAINNAKKHPSIYWVFGHNDRGSHYDNKILNRIWKTACRSIGVQIGLYEAVRHSLGCQLADQGYSLDFIQDVYKHTSIKTTRRYARRQRSMITDALENRGKVVHLERVQSVKGEGKT